MVTPAERIRQILSDGAPGAGDAGARDAGARDAGARDAGAGAPGTGPSGAGTLRRAADVPPPPDGATEERRRRLRERLDRLGVGRPAAGGPRGGGPGGPVAPLPTWVEETDERPLENQVAGAERETPHGSFLHAERRWPLASRHGRHPLGDALAHEVALRPREGGPGGRTTLHPRDAVFLDTETTGLAGGTGTVAFLVGLGRVEGDHFVVRQYCMRDFPEEAALLHAVLEDLGDAPLVTFNGRSFDWPLLTTRLRLHRLPAAPRAHLDLLPPARRLWADSLASHSLGSLEAHVLGLARENDLPGWRIPQAWFDFLRTGRAGLVALAFRHNELDVVSMLALMGAMGAILAEPAARSRATPRDHAGTARLLLEMGDIARARRCLEAGLEQARGEGQVPLRRLLGRICRRADDVDAALEHWGHVARYAPTFDAPAFEEVAKLLEHRRRDFPTALRWVEEALGQVERGSRLEAALRHRAGRLAAKAARRAGAAPPAAPA